MAKKKDEPAAEPDFEHSLQALQNTVRELESGGLTLTDSLARYEAGVNHLRRCLKLLDQAELRIRQLVDVDESGNAVLRDFRHEKSEQSGEAGRSNRTGRAARPRPRALWEEPDDEE